MRALFIVDIPHDQYLPPKDTDGNVVEGFFAKGGFGFWIAENTEAPLPNTVMVVVNTSDEILDAMALQTEHWIYVDEVADETQIA